MKPLFFLAIVSTFITSNLQEINAQSTKMVTDGTTFQAALDAAIPGDTIVLKNSGVPYTIAPRSLTAPDGFGGTVTRTYSFMADNPGTASQKITIRSESPSKKVTLKGDNQALGYVLYLNNAEHYAIQDVIVTFGGKGVMLDNSSYTTIKNVEIFDVGDEALHLRDATSYCVVESVYIHGTGKVQSSFGEGIYIGSDNSTWLEGNATALLSSSADGVTGERGKLYRKNCHDNIIRKSKIVDCQAEPFDVKEGTEYTIIEDCIIDASNVSGNNYADSHIDLKGNKAIVRGCTFTLTGANPTFKQGVMTNPRERAGALASETANDNIIHNNSFLIPSSTLAVKVLSGSVGNSVGTVIYGNSPFGASMKGTFSPEVPNWYKSSKYFRDYTTAIGSSTQKAEFHPTLRIDMAQTPQIHFTAKQAGAVSMDLVSPSGRIVFSYSNELSASETLTIPLTSEKGVAKGIYLLRYSFPEGSGATKLLVSQ